MKSSSNISKNTQSSTDVPLLTTEDELAAFVNQDDNKSIPWQNAVYKCWWNFARLFRNPFKQKRKELRLLDQVNILISQGEADKIADVCEKYISLHRIVENTKARARLEKWITRLIVGYLCIVAVFLSGTSLKEWLISKELPYISIEPSVLIALLTTTTVNIVALGFILVRGLFHEHEKEDIKKEQTTGSNTNNDEG